MRVYIFFHLDDEGLISARESVRAMSDAEVMQEAAKQAITRFAHCAAFQVWRDAWQIGSGMPKNAS